jgi:hypothetical protein
MAEAVLISAERAKGIRRLVLVGLGLAGVVAVSGVLLVANDYGRYGLVVLVVAAALGGSGYVALRALRDLPPTARRSCILAGVLFLVLSLPLVPIWIGLLTAITGVGMLVVVLAPEHEAP